MHYPAIARQIFGADAFLAMSGATLLPAVNDFMTGLGVYTWDRFRHETKRERTKFIKNQKDVSTAWTGEFESSLDILATARAHSFPIPLRT